MIKLVFSLNQVIFLSFEKALLKVLERDDLNDIIDNAYDYIYKQRNWYHNAKLYKKLYSELKNGK